MKVSILVINIVLPMIVSIGLYSYAFLSNRWNSINNDLIYHYNQTNNKSIQLENRLLPHAFRSQYGLFGYCLDYKWLNLLTIKASRHVENEVQSKSVVSSPSCNDSFIKCKETNTCVKKCDKIPGCPSYVDEKDCDRLSNQRRYYWEKGNCMWQSISMDHHDILRYLSPNSTSPSDFHYYVKHIRHLIMLLLFVAAPLLTFMALLILFCINCVDRFYSIPFAFVSLFSLASFISGAGGLGIFLYEWIQERSYRPDFTYESGQTEAFIVAFNPWIVNVERLGLAFWLTVAAISASLFTTILSCCFCCALQSDKSKLRIHVQNDKYVIVHTSPYDE